MQHDDLSPSQDAAQPTSAGQGLPETAGSASLATSEHTPGPWFPVWNDHYWEISLADDRHGPTIGSVWARETGVPASSVADARLIAAAPDLLAALKRAENLIAAAFGNHAESSPTLEDIRAAIAKAEGRP